MHLDIFHTKNLKLFHPEGLPRIWSFFATSGEWTGFVSSPARLLFLGWLNRSCLYSSRCLRRPTHLAHNTHTLPLPCSLTMPV